MLHTLHTAAFVLAQSVTVISGSGEDGGGKLKASLAWALVLLCVVLGTLVTVNPVKRESEIKGRVE